MGNELEHLVQASYLGVGHTEAEEDRVGGRDPGGDFGMDEEGETLKISVCLAHGHTTNRRQSWLAEPRVSPESVPQRFPGILY